MSISKYRRSVDSLDLNFQKNNKITSNLKDSSITKSIHIKKLKTLLAIDEKKILEIKNKNKKFSSFHLVDENDKYKQIQKNLQNTILNISFKMIKDFKFDLDLDDISPKRPRKSNTSKKNINQNSNNKKRQSLKLSRHSKKMTQIKQIVNEINRRIKRINNLYDSFGEDESDKEKEQGNYGLNPRSIFMDIYDIFLFLSSEFCILYIPYRLAKTKMRINTDEYFILTMINISEFIYIIDLIFGFFRWFYDNEFKLVSDIYTITINYLSGNFIIDLIMAIPFYTILKLNENEKYGYYIGYNDEHFLLKILVCLKAFKIFKINKIKNNRVTYFFNKKLARNYYCERLYQIINFIIFILSIFNLIICYHIYMAELSYPNWIVSYDLQDKTFIEIYITSFYFIIATMTSVGYGDIVCKSSEERYFQIILLSIGLVAYSWIISAVGDYVKNKSRAMDNFNRDMTKLEEIRITYPNMPFKLYNKIQQHIQRMLTQNKKYEYNILINSLPSNLQNLILFQIHKNEIERFTFFKECDNSDFILKVLTHFIPVFSKKNIVLVGEGEFYENIFFIKDGKLALEAIIDLDNIEMSIEKYLKYRFDEIEQIQDFLDDDNGNSNIKSSIRDDININKILGKRGKVRTKKLIGMISKQFENIEDTPSFDDTNIDQEIGKCDFHTELEDVYKGNIEYIHILDLLKNEYFGEILMFLNIQNPLSLKVKSKRVELYILRKKDSFNIRREYQNIWKRIHKKSIHNIKSLKSVTLNVINRYCEMNGIIVKNNEIVKSGFRTSLTKYNSNKSNYTSLTIKSKFDPKFNITFKSKKTSLTSLRNSVQIIDYNDDNNKNKNKKTDKNKYKQKKSLKITNRLNLNDDKEKISKKEVKRGKSSMNNNIFKKRKIKNENSESSNSSIQSLDTKIIKKSKEQKKNNNFNCITQVSTISLYIKSSYENIHNISKGHYINNNQFQDLIKNIISNCIKTNLNEIDKYYSDKFNKLNPDLIKLSDKNNFYSKSDKNKYNNKKEIFADKNVNYININNLQLNSIQIKNKKILSESKINNNASNELLNENNINNEPVQTFRKEKEEENNFKNNIKIKYYNNAKNICSNDIKKDEDVNNIQDVNLHYVNNFCFIY